MTDNDNPGRPERETYARIAEEIERLVESAERLRALGDDVDNPAVERNAKRVEGVATTLQDNVPPELTEE